MATVAAVPEAPRVRQVVSTRLATRFGVFRAVGYRDTCDGREHIALVFGDVARDDVLVRVHSECLTGDVFSSVHCECGEQLDFALRAIASHGGGVVVYVRGHEGRGIGLLAKLKAYRLQDQGLDTVDANLALGLPEDARDYGVAVDILRDLGVTSVRLMSNNPSKQAALEKHALRVVDRVPVLIRPTPESLRYLQTKRERMGHQLPQLEDVVAHA
jgi:3,4-dihydroxy 2-butanone 4-phosphate synthase / GTP cyclohydrolase II